MLKQAIRHLSARISAETRQTADGVALPMQIAALPWRRDGDTGEVEVLLITSRTSGRWIIPKGWPMWRKKDWEAAAIEAFEEAGVEGSIGKDPIGSFEHDKKRAGADPIRFLIKVYPLQVVRCLEEWPERRERQRKWLSLGDAARFVSAEGLRQILKQFRG
jgi:8-oxo-dGTP pyrophosphatase MutT (NUDIX family)